jgi:type II secretory pathway component PulF
MLLFLAVRRLLKEISQERREVSAQVESLFREEEDQLDRAERYLSHEAIARKLAEIRSRGPGALSREEPSSSAEAARTEEEEPDALGRKESSVLAEAARPEEIRPGAFARDESSALAGAACSDEMGSEETIRVLERSAPFLYDKAPALREEVPTQPAPVEEEAPQAPPLPAEVPKKKERKKRARLTQADLKSPREWRRSPVNRRDLAAFTRELAILLNSGIASERALTVLGRSRADHRSFQLLILAILRDLRTGVSLPVAFSRYPVIFSAEYSGLIQAGAETGQLPEVMTTLANDLEREDELARRVSAAMVYPVFVLGSALVCNLAIFLYVFPQIAQILTEMKVSLPLSTRFMLFATDLVRNPKILLLAVPAGLLLLRQTARYLNSSSGKYLLGMLKFTTPLIGMLHRKLFAEKFCRAMGIFCEYGIPMLTAIRMMRQIFRSPYLDRHVFASLESDVCNGTELGDALRASSRIPRIVTAFVSIGSHSGRLPQCLHKAARVFEFEIDNAIRRVVTMIEPLVVLLLGGFILFVILSIFLPLNHLIATMGQ